MHTVLIYSGGLDSTTLLYQLLDAGHQVQALSINYGQRHRHELTCARALCAGHQLPWQLADLSALTPLLTGSSQTDLTVPVPHGHYTDASMKQTVVPNRNMLLLSVALAWAISQHADAVAYAAHAGDHAIYPDCRPVFVEAMQHAAHVCDWHPVQLLAPYLQMTKADIVQRGAARSWQDSPDAPLIPLRRRT